VVVSLTMFVPMSHNLFHNREEAARAVDYIIIMGYDEHYATSQIAGPNASIGFVETGITRTLQEVPYYQIILGVPFYVRVWRVTQTPLGNAVTQTALTMDAAYSLFVENGAVFEWCEVTMSYYAEFRGVDAYGNIYTRKTWLEDERSMAAKMELAAYHNLAGVAGWRKGLESEGVWGVIYAFVSN